MKSLLLITIFFTSLFALGQDTYFQQKVDTYIEVELDDEAHFLRGFEKLIYHNNSPKRFSTYLILLIINWK